MLELVKKIFKPFNVLFYTLVVFTLDCGSAFAQVRVDSLEYLGFGLKQNIFFTRFDKQLNTFHLNSGLKFNLDPGDFEIRVNEYFYSTFVKGPQNSIREEQHLTIKSAYKLNPNIKFGLLGSSSVLSDNRSLGINRTSVSFATLFSEFAPVNNIFFSPFAGYSDNRQIGETDPGLVYGMEGVAGNLLLSDFRINSEFRLRNEDISPRKNMIRYFQLNAINVFEQDISNTINFLFTQNRKDFYFQTDSLTRERFSISNNIESRTETVYALQDRLMYDKILNALSLNITGRISMRTVDRDTRYKNPDAAGLSVFDTKIEELKLDFEGITRYTSVLFDGQMRFTFSERDEKNIAKPYTEIDQTFFDQRSEIESRKNNNSSRLSLTLFGNLKFSERDRLNVSFYQSKLKYDTPSLLNDDDRDEILSILRLRYSRFINPYFEAFINAEGTYSHIVYIFAGRSSNNNVNRIIRLRAGGDYTGKRFSSYNSFEVSANYTVYDFEDLTSNFQSFSFRQMTALDSTTIRLTDRISLFSYAVVKLSEQGDFNWTNFSSRPSRFLQEIYIEPRLILHLQNSSLSAGVRYFSLNTFNFEKLNRIPDTEYSSIGPIAIINLNLWYRLNIYLNGFYEFIRTDGNPVREQANLIMHVNWKF